MGGAVLKGLLLSRAESPSPQAFPIKSFIACTKTPESAKALRKSISEYADDVMVSHDNAVECMERAEVVVFAFKPWMARSILSQSGVREALVGKLVISMLAGLTPTSLRKMIGGDHASFFNVVRALPNVGASFRQSTTLLDISAAPYLFNQDKSLLETIFLSVGSIKYLPPEQFDLGTMIVGGTIALLSVGIDGLLDGCVSEGMRRSDANELVLSSLNALCVALESGIRPDALRESISSPGGCTIAALLALSRRGTRADFSDAVIEGTGVVRKMKDN